MNREARQVWTVELRASTSTLLLVSMSRIRRIVVTCNLRGVHGPVAAVAEGDGEHNYAPPISLVFFPRRDTFASESIPEGEDPLR